MKSAFVDPRKSALEVPIGKTLDEEHDNNRFGGREGTNDRKRNNKYDDLGEKAELFSSDAEASPYATGLPKPGFMASIIRRNGPKTPLTSIIRSSSGLASPRSFRTARSSFASYTTASSGPFSYRHAGAILADGRSMQHSVCYPTFSGNFSASYDRLWNMVMYLAMRYRSPSASYPHWVLRAQLDEVIMRGLDPITASHHEEIWLQDNTYVTELILNLISELAKYKVDGVLVLDLSDEKDRLQLRDDIYVYVIEFFRRTELFEQNLSMAGKAFSSMWLEYLHSRGILLDPKNELDWSGRGQHVEYGPEDEDRVPLASEKVLGHSQTALVDRVKCRRIRLARKKIVCNRRLKKEDVVTEVEHLTKLQHAHIVRLVGTYTLRKDLVILLYPAADMDLESFMDEIPKDSSFFPTKGDYATILHIFLGCLSNAITYIHEHNVKHLDIKPKNLLVQFRGNIIPKIYVADFGIARSYKSAVDSETDSPTSFTRTYAAPEVVQQDVKGLKADIFSLGCVFIEMIATIFASTILPEKGRQMLFDLRQTKTGSTPFYANIEVVTGWYEATMEEYRRGVSESTVPNWPPFIEPDFARLVPKMIMESPASRPTASELKAKTLDMCCMRCNDGPEPFEAAK